MTHKTLSIALTTAIVGLSYSGPAIAADLGGRPGSIKDPPPQYIESVPTYKFYLAARGGLTFPEDTDFNTLGLGVTNEYELGYFFSGAAGLSNLAGVPGLRGEIEIGYSQADVESHNVGGAKFTGGNAFGRTALTYGLASLYYDFNTGTIVRPFIGAGGGIADVSFENHGVTGIGTLLDSSDTAYAYHITAGANVEITKSLNFELAYRYLGTTGAELTARNGTKTEVDTGDHQIMFGLRQSF
ncbi:MAG: outer membrane beta-barrel protein [Hyphomicrobiaceae bacterium]|nr:outer membrane beta-barrel protein [Hyphomicrobiaceae bacterium]